MTAQIATANYYVPAPEAHEEVDFMTMFTNQNDDNAPHHDMSSQHQQHQYAMAAPSLPATTVQQPLQAYHGAAMSAATTTATTMLHNNGQWMQHHMTSPYPAMDMYNPALGQQFVPAQVSAPVAQYVEPAVALPSNRPASAPMATSAFSAFTQAAVSTPPAAPASSDSGVKSSPAATATSPVTGSTASPTSGRTSPVAGATAEGIVAAAAAAATAAVDGNNETRQVRRKRKLTPEDKRRICEIYRNSQGKIRQEDIAKEYSVDRSTISKILNQEERWLDPEQPNASSLLARRPGGRYPAIEEEMHRWLDDAVMHGREVRDAEAREEALKIGLRLGHPHFQASSKWWDGVKRRRIEEGRAMPTTRRPQPIVMPGLVRSYSAMAVDAIPRQAFPGVAGPSQHHYSMMDHSHMLPAGMVPMPMTYAVRARSQSSPQVMAGYAAQPSSFGPAPRQRHSPERHSPVTPLSRNRSYTGSAGSPNSAGRPSPLHRGGSSQGRPSPHMRLGASAFGLTPVRHEAPAALTMTATDLAPAAEIATPTHHAGPPPPSLSPLSVSTSDDINTAATATLSPSTPLTPAQASFATIPMPTDCVDLGMQQYTACDPNHASMVYMTQPMVCYPGQQVMQPVYPGYEYVQPQW
ncbi:uncharacterized protein EHS24_007763 [Apiotrichum porosum]|uniref:HTH CENPB-type domain-containing protein n=1 Tax=Apiotrichum porosum TaxID=105984 RepID=A0A427XV50_9TREE|nr:uncharacterized protein EHS24_007763 [Apiotrichum porosum]RSH82768.1 hypothetical protein EHS24_007763 [Apiotrichum porosum]